MSTIRVLKAANVDSSLRESEERGCRPISLRAFLQAENRKLQNTVAQLQQDTRALRAALQSN